MNKFEQVSSDDHQMSLAGGLGQGQGVQGLISGSLYSVVQCIVGNGHMRTPSPPVNRQTVTSENIYLPSTSLVCGRNIDVPVTHITWFYVFMQADKMLVKNSENLLDAIAKMLSAAEATSVKVRFSAYN